MEMSFDVERRKPFQILPSHPLKRQRMLPSLPLKRLLILPFLLEFALSDINSALEQLEATLMLLAETAEMVLLGLKIKNAKLDFLAIRALPLITSTVIRVLCNSLHKPFAYV